MKSDLCAQIDDQVIELHVFKRVQDTSLQEHLEICPKCQARTDEYRSFVSVLRRALYMLYEREGRAEQYIISRSNDS